MILHPRRKSPTSSLSFSSHTSSTNSNNRQDHTCHYFITIIITKRPLWVLVVLFVGTVNLWRSQTQPPTTNHSMLRLLWPETISNNKNNNQFYPQRQLPIIDIISVGSLLTPHKLQTQAQTIGNHPFVRHFYAITERNDTDAHCYTDLNSEALDFVLQFCRNVQDESYLSGMLRKKLFRPKKHIGHLCGTKRAIEGLYKVLLQYRHAYNTATSADKDELPDYLFLIDDDTYLNVEQVTNDLFRYHPRHLPYALSGCHCDHLQTSGLTFPHQGFGSFYSQAALQNLVRPIDCRNRTTAFTKLACERLQLNSIGELNFFSNTMSVLELMYSFASAHPFTQAKHWTDSGYCFQANHALSYFVNYYHVTVPEEQFVQNDKSSVDLRKRYSFQSLHPPNHTATAVLTDCYNMAEKCTPESRICAGIDPQQIEFLYQAWQQQTPNDPKHSRWG